MKKFKLRLFLDYKKEEKWINKLAQEGLSLISCKPFLYFFEKTKPGEYLYAIELFANKASDHSGKEYINLLQECNIEYLASIYGWGYLRKKAIDGAFDLYSDIKSNLSYIKRLRLNYLVGVLYIILLTFIIRSFLMKYYVIGVVLGVLFIFLIISFFSQFLKYNNQIKYLKKENLIRE